MFTQAIGARGEDAACLFLQRKGFRIVARNIHMRVCEIDIIARRDRLFVFVEVKTRALESRARHSSVFGELFGRISERQSKRIRIGAAYFMQFYGSDFDLRFDACGVILFPNQKALVHYLPNAF